MYDYPHIDHAGKYLKRYETFRFARDLKLQLIDPKPYILVPPDAVDFPDVSFYQGEIDWDYFASKNRHVIIRAGQNEWIDPMFEINYTAAGQRGLLRGVYWFYDGRASPTIQSNLLINLLRGREPEMEVIADWERNYSGQYEGLPNVCDFMQKVELGLPNLNTLAGMYTGYYWFTDNSSAAVNAGQYTYLKDRPLWLAWYGAPEYVRIPPPWTEWTHWQYGTPVEDHGQQSHEIDKNKGNGNAAAYSIRYGSGTIPDPPPGGTMKGTMKGYTVNVRDPQGVVVTALRINDVVYGDLFTDNRERIRFSKIYRANGTIENLGQECTAVTNDDAATPVYYMVLTNESEPTPEPPPVPESVFITHTFNDTLLIDGQEYAAIFTVENVEYIPKA